MSCYVNFIGIKGKADPKSPPKSGLYIENVAGIDIKNASDISTYENGLELLEEAIKQGIDDAANDALNLMKSVRINAVIDMFLHRQFTPDIISTPEPLGVWGGVQYKKNNASFQTLTTFDLKTIFYKAAVDVPSVYTVLKDGNRQYILSKDGYFYEIVSFDVNGFPISYIDDSGATVVLVPTDVLPSAIADEILAIPVITFVAKSDEISIKTDYSIPLYRVSGADKVNTGCSGCRSTFSNKNLYYENATFGLTADLNYVCERERVVCAILHDIKNACLYAAALRIGEKWLSTTRLNFMAIHSKEWLTETMPKWKERYEKELAISKRYLESRIRTIDKNCFECQGMVVLSNIP